VSVHIAIKKRIQELDEEIDSRVYRLYGLTEADKKVEEKNEKIISEIA
jgi:hypothetical protein